MCGEGAGLGETWQLGVSRECYPVEEEAMVMRVENLRCEVPVPNRTWAASFTPSGARMKYRFLWQAQEPRSGRSKLMVKL